MKSSRRRSRFTNSWRLLLPDNADVFQTLYDLQSNAGQKDEALAYLKKYAALKPGDASAQRTLGDMLYERKDAAGALVAYRAALKANPAGQRLLQKVCRTGLDRQAPRPRKKKSRSFPGASMRGRRTQPCTRRLPISIAHRARAPKAIPLYQKSIQIDPRDPALLSSLADCQVKSGAVQDAILTYEQATAMNPNANKEYKSARRSLHAAEKDRPGDQGL